VDAETGQPNHLPWEDWRPGDDEHTSGWMRATAPSGDSTYQGRVAWSGELGYGVRAAEPVEPAESAEPPVDGGGS